ncbi:unnamed protein product [Caenorhabditis angaria]|uniref:K Homology domain-containing protein n=1 Tax=Caenorhabditis angaria TaxID=860376 RepID=A0A9P1MZD2_9PELO|nr:unnamed protein product [Caenorhabditis angaria]
MDYFQTTQQRNSQQQNSSTSAQQQYLPYNGISQQKFQNNQNTNMFYQQSSQQQQHNTQQSGYFQIQPASAPLDAQQSYHQPPQQQSQTQTRQNSHNNGHHQQSGGMYGNNSGNGGVQSSGGHQHRRGGNNMNQHHNQNLHGHNQQSLQHQSHQQQTSQHNQHHPRRQPQQQQQQHSQYQQRSHNSNNHHQQPHQSQSHQQSGSGSGQSQQQQQSQHQHPFGVPPPPLSELPVRIAIESKHVGAIIGQGGNQIRIITKESHAKVVVETEKTSPNKNNNGGHRQSEEKVINIIGSNENCTKAVYKILEVVQRETIKEDGDLGADIELKIRAHDPLVGRLIGKQGATIKQIMHETGTQILVSKFSSETQKHAENSIPLLERTITVRGQTIDCVVQAEAKISAKLKKCYEVDLHHRLQAIQTNFQQNNSSITSLTSPSSATDAFGSIQRANSAAAAAAGIPPLPFPNNTMKCLRIWVPDNMVGALIGAKGKHIKQIIRDSQANVKIDSAEEKVKRQEEMNGSNTESNEEVAETSGNVENEKENENENENEDKKEEKKENEEKEENAEKKKDDKEEENDEKEEKEEKEDDEKPQNKEKKIEERMVTITGTDLQLLRAQQLIYEKMAEQTPQNFTDLKLRTELSVPSKIVGRIIGKGGQNVRELQRITGAIVKIPEEERNGSQEPVYKDKGEDGTTVVRIIGNVPASHNVQFRLSQLVADYMRSEKKKEQTDNNGSNTSSTSPPPAHSPTQQSSSP